MRILATAAVFALAQCLAVAAHAQCAPATQKLIGEAKFAEARVDAQALLKKNGSDDAALHCMGRIADAEGKSGDAVDWFEKAVKVNDRNALHHFWLGNSLGDEAQKANKLRQPFLARRVKSEFERAVALDPTYVDARIGLKEFYILAPGVMGGSMEKAKEQIAEITKLNPMRGHIEGAKLAEREKDVAGAEKEWLAATTAAPDSVVAFNSLGQFYKRQKKWVAATTAFEQVLRIKPDAIGAHLNIGGVSAASGENLDRGEREIKEWLSFATKDAPMMNHYAAQLWLGQIYQAQGKKDLARGAYQAALTANPKGEDAKKGLTAIGK